MTRSYMATHNLIAVSANAKETAINTEQTLDTTMLCALGDVINMTHRRESNENEATGKEEPDTLYDLGSIVESAAFNFEKAQPQHFAFLLAYALGQISTAAAGAGYQHTITPISGDLDEDRSNPSFTAGQRLGNNVLRRRVASIFVDSIVATFAKDSWCKIVGNLKGTGKYTDNIVKESVTEVYNATSLTLSANAVHGSTAAERLQNIQQVRVLVPTTGEYAEVTVTAVSSATPAVLTIAAPGGAATSTTYEVLYIAAESGWMSFPAKVTETPLRVSQMTLTVGGKWSGSAFLGGRELQAEMKSIDWNFSNNIAVEFVPGAGGTYASRAMRGGRTQKITLNREFREFILQQRMLDNEELGVYILAEGALYDATHKYQIEIIFPSVAVLAAPISVDGKRLAEAGDLQVLEDDTYGSVIVKIKNLQTAYAA